MYLQQKVAIIHGSLVKVIATGTVMGAILGLLLVVAMKLTGATEDGLATPFLTMTVSGLFYTVVNRYSTKKNGVFTFYQNANEKSAMAIGWDWVIALLTSALPTSLAVPQIASIMWRFPPSFLFTGALFFFIWKFLYLAVIVKASGINSTEMVVFMARDCLRDELGYLADEITVSYDNSILSLSGLVSHRDQAKDIRLAVVGLPGVVDVDSSGLTIGRK